MSTTNKRMTNGEINRLGNTIRAEYVDMTDDTLTKLQAHRTSHKDTLAKVFSIVSKESRSISRESISTYRIKRIESILNKLYRYPSMDFSRMWDIGGCRCILHSNKQVYQLKSRLSNIQGLKIRKEYDYIESPKEEGYRSLHLFLQLEGSSIVIELQIRNRIDHSWATLVEITDLLYNSKLKEHKKDKKLLRFHYLLSLRDQLTDKQRIEIIKVLNKYKYFEKLSSVFARNYIEVRKQWLDIENKHNHRYFLIETTSEKVPQISSYKSFEEAEEEYFRIYKLKANANVVLTHLPKPSYDQISIAYSNYILTFHSFIDDCFQIYETLIKNTLKNKKVFPFIKYFKEYSDLNIYQIKNQLNEIIEFNKLKPKNTNKSRFKKKKKEWISDIDRNIKKRNTKNDKFAKSFNNAVPKSLFTRNAFSFCTKRIMKVQERKLKKMLAITKDKK